MRFNLFERCFAIGHGDAQSIKGCDYIAQLARNRCKFVKFFFLLPGFILVAWKRDNINYLLKCDVRYIQKQPIIKNNNLLSKSSVDERV